VRLPRQPLAPIVSVYNSANAYQAEAPGGRPDDGSPRSAHPEGHLLRRGAGRSRLGCLDSQYGLDVQVGPDGPINIPESGFSAVNPPTGSGILSGQR